MIHCSVENQLINPPLLFDPYIQYDLQIKYLEENTWKQTILIPIKDCYFFRGIFFYGSKYKIRAEIIAEIRVITAFDIKIIYTQKLKKIRIRKG